MGSLTPGATLIYESPDGGNTVYSREQGKLERTLVGYKYDAYSKSFSNSYMRETLWKDILEAAETNQALQTAVQQCIIIYNLSKDHDGKSKT
jgi:hypothetical protein